MSLRALFISVLMALCISIRAFGQVDTNIPDLVVKKTPNWKDIRLNRRDLDQDTGNYVYFFSAPRKRVPKSKKWPCLDVRAIRITYDPVSNKIVRVKKSKFCSNPGKWRD